MEIGRKACMQMALIFVSVEYVFRVTNEVKELSYPFFKNR